jgi:hypothetical protein
MSQRAKPDANAKTTAHKQTAKRIRDSENAVPQLRNPYFSIVCVSAAYHPSCGEQFVI